MEKPKYMYGRIGTSYEHVRGMITGANRHCRLEGCTGLCFVVKWPSGKVTYPCSKGVEVRSDGQLQIQ